MRLGSSSAVFPAMALLALLGSGCVSAERFREVETANRNLTVQLEQCETQLQSERSRARELQAKLTGLEAQMQAKEAQVETLQDAKNKLQAAYDKLLAQFNEVVQASKLPEPVVVKQVLPPALDKALKTFAAAHPDAVEYDASRGLLKWKADILFDLGSDALKAAAVPALREFAGIVTSEAAKDFDVIIVGHTDNVPIVKPETKRKHPTNWHLSVHRAISVLFELTQAQVPPARLAVMGYGEYQPIASNDTPEGRAKNRRVEIFLVKRGKIAAAAAETAAGSALGPFALLPGEMFVR